ncbi:MAG: hypothetical protein WCR67_05565 [Bacilli bacterium]
MKKRIADYEFNQLDQETRIPEFQAFKTEQYFAKENADTPTENYSAPEVNKDTKKPVAENSKKEHKLSEKDLNNSLSNTPAASSTTATAQVSASASSSTVSTVVVSSSAAALVIAGGAAYGIVINDITVTPPTVEVTNLNIGSDYVLFDYDVSNLSADSTYKMYIESSFDSQSFEIENGSDQKFIDDLRPYTNYTLSLRKEGTESTNYYTKSFYTLKADEASLHFDVSRSFVQDNATLSLSYNIYLSSFYDLYDSFSLLLFYNIPEEVYVPQVKRENFSEVIYRDTENNGKYFTNSAENIPSGEYTISIEGTKGEEEPVTLGQYDYSLAYPENATYINYIDVTETEADYSFSGEVLGASINNLGCQMELEYLSADSEVIKNETLDFNINSNLINFTVNKDDDYSQLQYKMLIPINEVTYTYESSYYSFFTSPYDESIINDPIITINSADIDISGSFKEISASNSQATIEVTFTKDDQTTTTEDYHPSIDDQNTYSLKIDKPDNTTKIEVKTIYSFSSPSGRSYQFEKSVSQDMPYESELTSARVVQSYSYSTYRIQLDIDSYLPKDGYSKFINTSNNETLTIPANTSAAETSEIEAGQYDYTFQSFDGNDQPLSELQTISIDTSQVGSASYDINWVNPTNMVTTANDDGTMNIYFNLGFSSSDTSLYYNIDLDHYDEEDNLIHQFYQGTDKIAVIEDLPMAEYFYHGQVISSKEGLVDYQVGNEFYPSGTIWAPINYGPYGSLEAQEDGTTNLDIYLLEIYGDTEASLQIYAEDDTLLKELTLKNSDLVDKTYTLSLTGTVTSVKVHTSASFALNYDSDLAKLEEALLAESMTLKGNPYFTFDGTVTIP